MESRTEASGRAIVLQSHFISSSYHVYLETYAFACSFYVPVTLLFLKSLDGMGLLS